MMAATAIPLIIDVLPDIISLIAGLVHKKAAQAEVDLGAGTGPVKFGKVFEDVMSDLQKAAAAGSIPKQLPSDESVKLVIQSVVCSLKLQGQLISQPVLASGPTSSQSITLSAGQSLNITVK